MLILRIPSLIFLEVVVIPIWKEEESGNENIVGGFRILFLGNWKKNLRD
jgi:hypothetical protein